MILFTEAKLHQLNFPVPANLTPLPSVTLESLLDEASLPILHQVENQQNKSNFVITIPPDNSSENLNGQNTSLKIVNNDTIQHNDAIIQPMSSDQFKNFKIPWCKLPGHILIRCKNNQKLEITDYSTFVHLIVMELRQISNYIRKKIFENVAKEIVAKYPLTFQQQDSDGIIISNGHYRLMMKFIDHNSYVNRPHKNVSTESKLKKNVGKLRLLEKQTSGSINVQPDIELDAGKYEKLLNENLDKYSFNEMVPLLEKTYSSQRLSINEMICAVNDGENVKRLLEKWPVLKNPTYFLWHYDKLMNNQHSTDFITTVFRKNKHRIESFAKKSPLKKLKLICSSWPENHSITLKEAVDIFIAYFNDDNTIYKTFPHGTKQEEVFHEKGDPIIAEIGIFFEFISVL